MHVASHDLFNMKLRTCLDTGKVSDIHEYKIDIFVMGDDWAGKFDDLRDYCEVVYLSRTPEVSTTSIKNRIAEGKHNGMGCPPSEPTIPPIVKCATTQN